MVHGLRLAHWRHAHLQYAYECILKNDLVTIRRGLHGIIAVRIWGFVARERTQMPSAYCNQAYGCSGKHELMAAIIRAMCKIHCAHSFKTQEGIQRTILAQRKVAVFSTGKRFAKRTPAFFYRGTLQRPRCLRSCVESARYFRRMVQVLRLDQPRKENAPGLFSSHSYTSGSTSGDRQQVVRMTCCPGRIWQILPTAFLHAANMQHRRSRAGIAWGKPQAMQPRAITGRNYLKLASTRPR
jgi:hypothetical protein